MKLRFVSVVVSFIVSFNVSALTIGSWNLDWLDGSSAYGPKRHKDDYLQMADMFRRAHMDVMAFSEVGSKRVLRRVVGNHYLIEISHRASQRGRGYYPQFTGFAIRAGIVYQRNSDLKLNVDHDDQLRNAVDITLYKRHHPYLRLLSVHLKSRCFYQSDNFSRSCHLLKLQAIRLNQWIRHRKKEKLPFMILGDFNRRMANGKHHWFLKILRSDYHHSTSLYLSTQGLHSHCWSRTSWGAMKQFRQYIDHILYNQRVKRYVQSGSFRQITVPVSIAEKYHLSDHCPILIRLSD
ncbi:MAG: hypothetical protein CENE_03495 [Candidatus Celerinatantimonas neptuna]|nr:MAG: hypothetical protein CENE_03495 [Candidatus Celerinatantimonas neptuna]